MFIKKFDEFINENNIQQRITDNDGVLHTPDEVLEDWRNNGYNEYLDIEEMCNEFDEDFFDFREELIEKMTGEDLVLMMTKIHYPPFKGFGSEDFITVLCKSDNGIWNMSEDDIEDTFGIDPYQTYTFGDNFEGTVQLNDDLKNCIYGYASINKFGKANIKGLSDVTDYIIDNVDEDIYYADRMSTHSYSYIDNDLYINSYNWSRGKWVMENIKMYVANLTCEGSSNDKYLILSCEND